MFTYDAKKKPPAQTPQWTFETKKKHKTHDYFLETINPNPTGNNIETGILQRQTTPTPNSSTPNGGTPLPSNMQKQYEKHSGYSLADIRIFYNSEEPTKLCALAYAKGNTIHVGPNQEQHLPHEVGHVIQQKAGIVKPTLQSQGVHINDDEILERNADKIENMAITNQRHVLERQSTFSFPPVIQLTPKDAYEAGETAGKQYVRTHKNSRSLFDTRNKANIVVPSAHVAHETEYRQGYHDGYESVLKGITPAIITNHDELGQDVNIDTERMKFEGVNTAASWISLCGGRLFVSTTETGDSSWTPIVENIVAANGGKAPVQFTIFTGRHGDPFGEIVVKTHNDDTEYVSSVYRDEEHKGQDERARDKLKKKPAYTNIDIDVVDLMENFNRPIDPTTGKIFDGAALRTKPSSHTYAGMIQRIQNECTNSNHIVILAWCHSAMVFKKIVKNAGPPDTTVYPNDTESLKDFLATVPYDHT
ncbi:MAG: DUF4157 domain-containing protein [Candidatus Bathyarchaeota archaeon]|nr:DUF4157 domain-containing protein [Candidatus Termiticorpusculum sp.]